jgi:integrase
MRDDEQWRHGAGEDELESLALGNSELIDVVEARPPHRVVREQADELLRSKAIQIRKDSPGYLEVVEVVREAMKDALRQVRRRDEGERVPTPDAIPVSSLLLSQMLTKWKTLGGKGGKIRPKTADEAKKTVDAFIGLHGDLSVSAINKQHGTELRDHFIECGNAPGTVRKKFGLLNAVLTLAVHEDVIAVNPLRTVRLPKAGKGKRREFTSDELATLFAHPVFTAGERGDATTGDALFWTPLLSLYSGARLGELAQLRVEDFKRDPDHGWYYEIHERGEGMHVKNVHSTRVVPVHHELERLGLLDYVEQVRSSGELRVFPKLTKRANGQDGALSAAVNRMIDATGLTDPAIVFHSFRHTFITLAREAEIQGDVLREIVGHEGAKDVHVGYGDFPLSVKATAMRKVRVRGLDLSRVRFVDE